jgi:hypothetical protein
LITNVNTIQVLPGDGSDTYTITLDYSDSTAIVALLVDSEDSEITPTGYTVTNPAIGTREITFSTNITSDNTIVIYRDTEIKQLLELENNSKFSARYHEAAMDKLVRIAQEVKGDVDRSVKISVADDTAFDVLIGWADDTIADAGIVTNSTGTGLSFIDDILLIVSAVDNAAAAAASETNADGHANDAATAAANAESNDDSIAALVTEITDLVDPLSINIIDSNTSTYNIPATGGIIAIDPSLYDSYTYTLPASPNIGTSVTIKNAGPYQKTIDIVTQGSHLIDGVDALQMGWPWQAVSLMYTATNEWSLYSEQNHAAYEAWPKLIWAGLQDVTIRARGHNPSYSGSAPSRISMVFPDGVMRHHDGDLAIDFSTTGLGALDTGSISADNIYYVYLVPDTSSNLRGMNAIASESGPSTGPTGYTQWRYIGAVKSQQRSYDGYGAVNIVRFSQAGNQFHLYRPEDCPRILSKPSNQPTNQTWFANDNATYTNNDEGRNNILSDKVVPETFGHIRTSIQVEARDSTGHVHLTLMMSSTTPVGTVSFSYPNTVSVGTQIQGRVSIVERWLSRNNSDGKLYWLNSNGTGTNSAYYVFAVGWADREIRP